MKLIYKLFKNYNVIRIDGIYLKAGWKGCFLSHLKCIQYAKINKLKYIWVLEDDCTPCVNFIDRFATVNEYLANNDDWNLYLGACNRIEKKNLLKKLIYKNENFIEINSGYCMHMVCYNEKIYDSFLNIFFNQENKIETNINNLYQYDNLLFDKLNTKPIDIAWRYFTNAIISVPFLAYQTSEFSYVKNKPNKYYRSLLTTEKNCLEYLEEKIL